MAIVATVDDSFKRPGTVPFSWEVRPGVPKTRVFNPEPEPETLLFSSLPRNSPLRLKPLSHSQPLFPPALSPPSSSFISSSKSRSLSPLAPSFPTPSKLKPPPPSQSGLYSPAPSFRSTPRAFSERWQLNRSDRAEEEQDRWSEKTGSRSDREYCSDMETMSPWTVSSRRSVSPRWDSPKSSFSSLRFSPRLASEAEWVGFGLF
ncbi:hypothetical protein Bca52824_085079 [Brassica carinata]|uniref:Uncharacterized protein n=1 Tax=Brassica carinata TaxID=52824 RepID=A0A8X7PQQ2_BRACI|nr:hypothetical protein Bca52824_085079 [Brassica carinata]